MGKKLKVGIAGYGTVGKIRHKYIDAHPDMNVTALCDQNFSQELKASQGVKCFNSYKQLLAEKLDVLFVCLPNYLAPEVVINGLRKGLHVFCEKPPGRDIQDIVNVIKIERQWPHQIMMYGFNHRYHYSVKDAFKIIKSGELGQIISLKGVYGKSKIIRFDSDWRTRRIESGGGILLDQGIHMVDMIRLFTGEEFQEVYSFISNSFWKHDVEDNAYAIMKAESGIIAMLHSSATQWRHRFNLDIIMTKGAIILSGILSSTRSYGAETITVVYSEDNDEGDPREETKRYNEDISWRDEVNHFADIILKKVPMQHGSSIEALKTMQLVFKIYKADKEWSEKYSIKASNSEADALLKDENYGKII